MLTKENIFSILSEIPDPEIPVINIVELGIVREVHVQGEEVTVSITPTYTGCPAMLVIESDIMNKMRNAGIQNVKLKTVLSPAWTTDWLTEDAKRKLLEFGISPPSLATHKATITCPRCNSANTILKSAFGSTACKALYICNNCMEPFQHFKCH